VAIAVGGADIASDEPDMAVWGAEHPVTSSARAIELVARSARGVITGSLGRRALRAPG